MALPVKPVKLCQVHAADGRVCNLNVPCHRKLDIRLGHTFRQSADLRQIVLRPNLECLGNPEPFFIRGNCGSKTGIYIESVIIVIGRGENTAAHLVVAPGTHRNFEVRCQRALYFVGLGRHRPDCCGVEQIQLRELHTDFRTVCQHLHRCNGCRADRDRGCHGRTVLNLQGNRIGRYIAVRQIAVSRHGDCFVIIQCCLQRAVRVQIMVSELAVRILFIIDEHAAGDCLKRPVSVMDVGLIIARLHSSRERIVPLLAIPRMTVCGIRTSKTRQIQLHHLLIAASRRSSFRV